MPRDELRQPLRKRSLSERLWAKRRGRDHCLRRSCRHHGGGRHLVSRIPHPFAGEPVVVAAIPPAEELKTSSNHAETAAEESPQPTRAAEPSWRSRKHRPRITRRKPPSSWRCTGRSRPHRSPMSWSRAGWTFAARVETGPQAVRCLCPGHAHRGDHLGPAQDRHPARRHGHQSAPDQKAIKELPGDVSFGFRALWREPAGAGQQGACQGARGHASAAARATRLSGNQSRSADIAVRCAGRGEPQIAPLDAQSICRLHRHHQLHGRPVSAVPDSLAP